MPLVPEETIRALVSSYASLVDRAGEFVDGHLVEPDKKHFPDEYKGDLESVQGFFKRMLSYSALDEETSYELQFIEQQASEDGSSKGGCSSGGCSTGAGKAGPNLMIERDASGHYSLGVNVADASDSMVLATSYARLLGAMTLEEAGGLAKGLGPRRVAAPDATTLGVESEIAAIFSGFGILLAEGSCVYSKSCGGLKSHQATFLSVDEIALLLSVYVRQHGLSPSVVRKYLSTTQSESFAEALAWVDSNPKLMRSLANAPQSVASGFFEIEGKKGLFYRILSRTTESEPGVESLQVRVTEKSKHFAEAKRLVSEALEEDDRSTV